MTARFPFAHCYRHSHAADDARHQPRRGFIRVGRGFLPPVRVGSPGRPAATGTSHRKPAQSPVTERPQDAWPKALQPGTSVTGFGAGRGFSPGRRLGANTPYRPEAAKTGHRRSAHPCTPVESGQTRTRSLAWCCKLPAACLLSVAIRVPIRAIRGRPCAQTGKTRPKPETHPRRRPSATSKDRKSGGKTGNPGRALASTPSTPSTRAR